MIGLIGIFGLSIFQFLDHYSYLHFLTLSIAVISYEGNSDDVLKTV